MAQTRLAAAVTALALSLALAGPAFACSTDDTAYFDTFTDSTCLLTPLQSAALDPLGGIRLATNGTPTSTTWDSDADFDNGVSYQSLVFGPVGVSTLARNGTGAAAALELPATTMPLTRDVAGAVIAPTATVAGALDNDNVDDPSVVKAGSTYVMYYSGGAEDGSGPAIFRATSSDGKAWTKTGVVLAPTAGGLDERGVFAPDVQYDAASTVPYTMFYSGKGATFGRIFRATSTDGISWTKYDSDADGKPDPVLDHGRAGSADSFSVQDPAVIKDGATYKMWYTGDDSNRKRVAYATSPDGISWSKGGKVIAPEDSLPANLADGAFAPTVWKDGSTYNMVLTGLKLTGGTGQTKLINASSNDGISWNIGSIALNQSGTNTKFDFSNLNSPFVLQDPGAAGSERFKLYYSGNTIDPVTKGFHTRIGLATSGNGNSWGKFSGAGFGNSELDIGALGTAFDARDASGPSVAAPGGTGAKFAGVYWGDRGLDFKPRLGAATSADGSTWTKATGPQADGSILALGTAAAFDNGGQRDPSLLYAEDTGTPTSPDYHVYFTGLTSARALSIGYANALETPVTLLPDNTSWANKAQLLTGDGSGFDSNAVSHPSVIKDGATFVLYYTGTDASGNTAIGRATSATANFAAITRGASAVLSPTPGTFDKDGVKDPVVTLFSAGDYRMTYTGVEKLSDPGGDVRTIERIGLATSADGITWTKQGVLVDPSQSEDAFDETGVEPSGLVVDGTDIHLFYTGLDAAGRTRGGHATGDTATATGSVENGWATYQLGNPTTTVRDFRKIIRTSSGDSPEVTLWMSFLQPYSSSGSELWSSFFPVTVANTSEDLNFLLNIRGVRWQARLSDPSANPSLDKVEIQHAPVQFTPNASVQTLSITPPVGQAISHWGDMTVHATTFAPAGGGSASASVHVLDATSGEELASQALNLGSDTTINLFAIDGATHPALLARFDMTSGSPFTATPLISSLKVLFNALAAPPAPPAPVLTLAASAITVTFGQPVTLSGNLSQSGAPLAGQGVALQQQAAGAGAFSPATSSTTDAAGNYAAAVTPSSNTVYKATFAGAAEPTVTVTVRPLVKLKAVRNGKFGVFSGSVAPGMFNEPIQIQQLKAGAWVPFASAKTDATAKFKVSKTIKKCGKFTFKAVDAAGTTHDLGESLRVNVEPHRITMKAAAKKRTVTFSGKVAPFHKSGTVVIARVVGKKLVKIGKAKITKKSTFKLVKKLKKGKYVFVASQAADKCHFAGKSAQRKLVVR